MLRLPRLVLFSTLLHSCALAADIVQESVSATLTLTGPTTNATLPLANATLANETLANATAQLATLLTSQRCLSPTSSWLKLTPLDFEAVGQVELFGVSPAKWAGAPQAPVAAGLAVALRSGLLQPPGCAYSNVSCAAGSCCIQTGRVTVGAAQEMTEGLLVNYTITGFGPAGAAALNDTLPLLCDNAVGCAATRSETAQLVSELFAALAPSRVGWPAANATVLLALLAELPYSASGPNLGCTGEQVGIALATAAQQGTAAPNLASCFSSAGLGTAVVAVIDGPRVSFGLAVPPSPPASPPPAPLPPPPLPPVHYSTSTEGPSVNDGVTNSYIAQLQPVFIAASLFVILICAASAAYYYRRKRLAAAAAAVATESAPAASEPARQRHGGDAGCDDSGGSDDNVQAPCSSCMGGGDWAAARAGAARRDQDWQPSPADMVGEPRRARVPPPLPPRGPSPLPSRVGGLELEADGDFFRGRRPQQLQTTEEGLTPEEWAPGPSRRASAASKTEASKKWCAAAAPFFQERVLTTALHIRWWNTKLGIRFTTPSSNK